MTDTRIAQMAALIDDARTLCADMSDECSHTDHDARFFLTSIRVRLNQSLKSLQSLEKLKPGEAS
jgi:hypothetical protein